MKISYKPQNIQSGLYAFICIDNENDTQTSPKALTTKIKQKQEKHNYFICEEIDKENPKESQLFYIFKDDDNYYTIVSYETNECIGINTDNEDIGSPIVQLPIDFTNNMKWEFVQPQHEENKDKENEEVKLTDYNGLFNN